MKYTRNTSRLPPAQRALGIAIGVLALAGAPASSMAAIVCSSPSLPVPANQDGTYLNLQTGGTSNSEAGTPGWDINLYASGVPTLLLYFYWPTIPADNAGGVSTGTVYNVLNSGDTIGPTQTYSTVSGGPVPYANWHSGQTGKYLGLRFYNENTLALNYGWIQLDTGAGSGFPATVNQYCYDDTGAAIAAGALPAPTPRPAPVPTLSAWSMALLGMGLAALAGLRRKR